jgi:phosphoribosylanthranilate isomerase
LERASVYPCGRDSHLRRDREGPASSGDGSGSGRSLRSKPIADILLLDSHRRGDRQIGALGVTHSWEIDRKIVESVRIPVIIAGGLGPDNVMDAIRAVQPAGVDSKTKTDKDDGSHTKDLQKVRRFVERAKSLKE